MEKLATIIADNENWLMGRILDYAKQRDYTAYTSTLKEAWRLSIAGLSKSILTAIDTYDEIPEVSPNEDFTHEPVAVFGIIEAQRHRERGVPLPMFLGLMKYYRQSYSDLLHKEDLPLSDVQHYGVFLKRVFDRIEIGFCTEWAEGGAERIVQELQTSNRLMTNEKNKYLTIFESIPDPVIILDQDNKIENMNLAAAALLDKNAVAGSSYYRAPQSGLSAKGYGYEGRRRPEKNLQAVSGAIMPWIKDEVAGFGRQGLTTLVFDKEVDLFGEGKTFRIRLTRSLDISGKFDGLVIIMEDITSLKNALSEVRTLKGLIPICSHCKSIRDDTGYWLMLEEYVQEHSEATFTHGICPDCMKELYPELAASIEAKKSK